MDDEPTSGKMVQSDDWGDRIAASEGSDRVDEFTISSTQHADAPGEAIERTTVTSSITKITGTPSSRLIEARTRKAVTLTLWASEHDHVMMIPLHGGRVLPLLTHIVLSKAANETWIPFQVSVYCLECNTCCFLLGNHGVHHHHDLCRFRLSLPKTATVAYPAATTFAPCTCSRLVESIQAKSS